MITLSSWLPFGVIQDLGWTLIHFVWQGAALALLLAAALPASRSAQERYQAAFVTLVFMLAAPVITFIVLRNHAPQAFGLPGDLWRYVTDVSATVPWLSWIVTMWLAGVVIFCARAAGGLYVVYSLRRRGVCALPPAVARRCADLAQRAGLHAAVVFLQSSIANVPLVMGCLRPIVLLPVAVVMRLPLHQLEALVPDQMLDVLLGAGEEVVDADDVVAIRDQSIAQMRAQEAGTAGDEDRVASGQVSTTFGRRSRLSDGRGSIGWPSAPTRKYPCITRHEIGYLRGL